MTFLRKVPIRHLSQYEPNARSRMNYKWFLPVQTRWLDNDRYGHLNNAVYHGIFDSVINIFSIRHCGLNIRMGQSSRVGFMVVNKCEFFAPAQYPDVYLVGMRIVKLGKTSLNYQLGMFPMVNNDKLLNANMTHGYFQEQLLNDDIAKIFELEANCVGESVHVFVDPAKDNKPAAIPENWKENLSKLQ